MNQLLLFTVLNGYQKSPAGQAGIPAHRPGSPGKGRAGPARWPFRETTYIEISEPVTGHPGAGFNPARVHNLRGNRQQAGRRGNERGQQDGSKGNNRRPPRKRGRRPRRELLRALAAT